jgi:tetratricopeptide (TPR) repeat protein
MVDSQVASHSIEQSMDFFRRGKYLADQGLYHRALQQFSSALQHDDSNPEIWVFRAVMFIHLERYEDALKNCEEALKLVPNHAEAWLFRGVALRYLNNASGAYESYRRALGHSDEPVPTPGQWLRQGWVKISRILTPEMTL